MKTNSIKAALIIWILLILVITAGSLLPQVSTPEKYHLDKFIHGCAYAMLAFLAFFFTKNQKVFIFIIVLLIFIGGGIEILQTFIPGRSGTIGDFAADFIGSICGALLATKVRYQK